MRYCDLHTHSTASDGTTPPAELPARRPEAVTLIACVNCRATVQVAPSRDVETVQSSPERASDR